MKLFYLIAFVGLTSIPSFAAEYTSSCQKFAKPLAGGYCIHRPSNKENTSDDILYHFHGLAGSERNWQASYNYPDQLREAWVKKGVRLPTVVSVSFGSLFLLAEKNTSAKSGLFEIFTQQVLPEIEKNLGGLKGRRLLVGESMGGFNSTQLALKTNLFKKVALLCTPIHDSVSPFSPMEEVRKHIESSAVWQYYKDLSPETVTGAVENSVMISKIYFPDAAAWAKGDPFLLAKTVNTNTLPSFYIAVGKIDKYVIYESNAKFAELLKERGARVEWRPQFGGHCAIDIPSLAKFLGDPEKGDISK